MNKKVAILQSNYIPWKGYFDLINSVDVFVLYDDVQFTKNDWRNRNKIKTSNGISWITIPVYNTGLEQKICETKVSQYNWNKKHWNMLTANYSKAKCFKENKDIFEHIYNENISNYLSEINLKFITLICKLLHINTEIVWSKDLHLVGDKNEKLLDACIKLNATQYVSGPAAKDYLDENIFRQENINVEWFDYSRYKEYQQLFPPFEHGVSILDLIFNEGENSNFFLKTFTSK